MTSCLPEPVSYHNHSSPQTGRTVFSRSQLKFVLLTVVLLGISAALSACSSTAYVAQDDTVDSADNVVRDTDAVVNPSIANLPVVKLKDTSPLSQVVENIMAQRDDVRVILVGELHTRWDHHLVQLEILKQLHQDNPELAIGVEWFQRPFQKHLDNYIAGEITEREMLYLTGYFNRWRYDYRLYRPIMQYAREHKLPVVALNASRELTNALSITDFDDLPAELKEQLPESYDWSDKAYEKRLRSVFDEHPEYAGELEGFLRAQLTWDESMAESTAQYLDENPETRMLVFAGARHIEYGSGIPNRIKRRIDVELITILVSEDFMPVSENIADFLVLSEQQSQEPGGLIGALLDTEGKLLVIKDFSDNSAVKDAGVEKGAVIIGVDDVTVESFADFKLAVLDKKPGDSIVLYYIDNTEGGSKDIKSVNLELR